MCYEEKMINGMLMFRTMDGYTHLLHTNGGKMDLTDIEYPLRLCVELMYYSALGANGKTVDMKADQVKDSMRVFFTDEEIEEAQRILFFGP